MKKILLLFFALPLVGFAQHKTLAVAKTDSLQLHADVYLGTDVFGAFYFITDNTLTKRTRLKDWQYKNPALGRIAKADLQNALRIVLFYESFNTAVLLDNQLNEIRRINFSEQQLQTPIIATAVGLAAGNRLWVHNSLSQRIGLYDYLKNDWREITAPLTGTIKYYTSDFNYFDWIDAQSNWYRCNVYGKISVLGKVPEADQVQLLSDSGLLYKKDGRLYHFSFNGNKTELVDVDKKTFESFLYKDQILSIFTTEGIMNYKITLP